MSSPMMTRRFTRQDILPACLAFVALVLGLIIFGFFLLPHPMQIGSDEGYEAAAVERVIDGKGLPYVDAVSIRGPFLYWSQAIVHLLTGRFEWTGTRVLGVLASAATVVSTFLSGWAAGWPLAGAIGAAVYVFVIAITYAPGPGIGIHGEPVAIAFISTAFFLVAYALYRARTPRRRIVLLVLGGAVVAMGGLTKQTLAVSCGPLLVWILAHASLKVGHTSAGDPAPWRSVLTGWAFPFLAGGAGLVLAVLLRYALAGELGTFFFWSTGVSAKIYMSPFKGQVMKLMSAWFIREPWAILGTALALTVAFGSAFGRKTDLSPRGLLAGFGQAAFETAVGLMAMVLLVAAALPLRIWGHYFVPVWPFFGMTLGILVERFAVRETAAPRAAQTIVVLAFGGLLAATGVDHLDSLARQRAAGGWPNPRPNPVCAEIDRIAGHGREEVFISGLAGDLYITCRRRSTSMHTTTILVMGIVPPLWNQPSLAYVPPGSREKLLAELTARPPKVIIDHAISVTGTAMIDIPIYASFINDRYCRLSVMNDRGRTLTLFGRKDVPACEGRSP